MGARGRFGGYCRASTGLALAGLLLVGLARCSFGGLDDLVAEPDASTIDATAGAVTDGATTDGGAEAQAADASSGPFCAHAPSNVVFCNDFDESPAFAGWRTPGDTLTPPATEALDDASFVSPPFAWRAAIAPSPDSTGGGEAYLVHNHAALPGGYDFGYELRLDAYDVTNGSSTLLLLVSYLSATNVADAYSIRVYLSASQNRVVEQFDGDGGTGGQVFFDPRKLSPGAWHRVDLVVRTGATPVSSILLLVDGAQVATIQNASAHLFAARQLSFALGLVARGPTPTSQWTTRFDDVSLASPP